METRLGGFGGGSQNLARPGTCRLGQWGCGQRKSDEAACLLRMTTCSYSTTTADLLHIQQEVQVCEIMTMSNGVPLIPDI